MIFYNFIISVIGLDGISFIREYIYTATNIR